MPSWFVAHYISREGREGSNGVADHVKYREIRRTENLMIGGSSSVFEYKRKWKFYVVLFNLHYAIYYSRVENG